MNKRRIMIAILTLLAIVAAAAFIYPIFTREQVIAPPAPAFGSTIEVENARLVLPATAGRPAVVHFAVSNLGQDTVFVTAVNVEHTRAAEMYDTERPSPLEIANVPVQPGETVQFGTGEQQLVLADYDSFVVPGAELRMVLTFGNAEAVAVPLPVKYPD